MRAALVLLAVIGLLTRAMADTETGATGGVPSFENRQPTLVTRYMIALQGIFPNDDPAGTPNQQQAPNRGDAFLGEIKAVPFNFAPRGWALCEGQLLPINQNQALFALIGTTYGGNGQTNFALPDLRGRTPVGAGQGPGLVNYNLGDVAGSANPALTAANLPAHVHAVPGGHTAPEGGDAPIDNRQPVLALHFLIAANGEIMIAPWPQQPTGWSRCDGRLLPRASHTFLFNHIADTYGGDGVNNFALPDMRGRVVLGFDGNAGAWPLGRIDGENEITLGTFQMPAHTHTITGGTTGVAGGPDTSLDNYQPSLVMRWVIAFEGFFPSPSFGVSFPMVAEMRLTAGPVAAGLTSTVWKPLDGTLYLISDAEALFQVIGNSYGGDGDNNFRVPDLRQRASMDAGAGAPFANYIGVATIPLSAAQLPVHAHALPAEIAIKEQGGTDLVDDLGTVDFGTVRAAGGSTSRIFTITNSGVGDLVLGPIKKTGPNRTDFLPGAPSQATVPPNTSTTFSVDFTPAAAGFRSAILHVINNDPDESTFSFSVTGTRLTQREDWRLQHFNDAANTGDGADFNDYDRDGIVNIMEFATGGDPKRSNAAPVAFQKVGDLLELTYSRSKAAMEDGFGFAGEFRPDIALGAWSNSDVTQEVISENTEFQQVKASVVLSPTQSTGFMRLNVTSPP